MPTDNLPKRMAEAVTSHEWTDFPRSAHNQHNYYAECAVCQRDVPRITEVALSVRDELVAHLSARAAKAEARVGHAEAGAQLSSERLAKVRVWVTSDVVTAKSSFGDGYREAMRDVRDLLAPQSIETTAPTGERV